MSDADEISAEELLEAGAILVERYRVRFMLGRGAMGIVYAGEHVRFGRPVAIKVMSAEWSRKTPYRRRFEAEARAAGAAGHPNIIEVLDVGELDDGRLFSVMEMVDGVDLYTLLHEEAPLAISRVVRIVREIAYGLRAAHQRGIVHRDLKLENVMVRSLPEGEAIKILDFGIAAGVVAPGPGGERMTRPGLAIGTPEYMAPEQVDGEDPSPRFDIYALGVIAFELLTGALPIEDDVPMRLMARKCVEPAPAVTDLRPDVPPVVAAVIADCLAIDPTLRPQSMDDLLARLGDTPAPVAVAPVGRPPLEAPSAPAMDRTNEPTRDAPEDPATHPSGEVVTLDRGRGRGVAVAIILVGLTAGAAAWALSRASDAPSPAEDSAGDPLPAVAVAPESASADEAKMPPLEVPAPVQDPAPEPEEAETGPEVAPESEPQPRPKTKATTKTKTPPEPEPAATPKPSPKPPESDDAECDRVRERGLDARRAHDWNGLLSAARQRACWPSKREQTKLLTQAYMELGRFAECAKTGASSVDPEVERWVVLCQKRASQ